MTKTYKGFTRTELIDMIAAARSIQCKQQNFEKFGNNDYKRRNESILNWKNLYKTYPMTSKKYPEFSLVSLYERFCGNK